jgi:hypothetical protein
LECLLFECYFDDSMNVEWSYQSAHIALNRFTAFNSSNGPVPTRNNNNDNNNNNNNRTTEEQSDLIKSMIVSKPIDAPRTKALKALQQYRLYDDHAEKHWFASVTGKYYNSLFYPYIYI